MFNKSKHTMAKQIASCPKKNSPRSGKKMDIVASSIASESLFVWVRSTDSVESNVTSVFDESSAADSIGTPSVTQARSPSSHTYLPESLQFDIRSPSSSVPDVDSRVDNTYCRSTRNRGRLRAITRTSQVATRNIVSEEVSHHTDINDSDHIRENGSPRGEQHSISSSPTQSSGRRSLGRRFFNNDWKIPKAMRSLVPERNKNEEKSPLLNPDAIRGRRSLDMLELRDTRDDDCFRDDDGNCAKRHLPAEDPYDDVASTSILIGHPTSPQQMQVLSPSNAKHTRRITGGSTATRPPLPPPGKKYNRSSF